MKSKQQIKEQIDLFEVNGTEWEEVSKYYNDLITTEQLLFIVELEYRGIIYDYDGYPVIPDRYNCICDDICDNETQNITQLKQYLEAIL